MTTTTPNARDECLRIIKNVADTFASVGLKVRYQSVPKWDTPAASTPWWWENMQHMNSRQATLSCEHGKRRYRRSGLITVMCFGRTFGEAQAMAVALRDAHEGVSTPGDVMFTDATANEMGNDSHWYRYDFQVSFQYDEVR